MKRALLAAALLIQSPAFALSDAAREFMDISAKLEPVQCEKRKLRREIALAQAEKRAADVKTLRARFAAINRDATTARLEKRLAQLEPVLERSSDAEDLSAINMQRREAFYRCD